MKISVFGAGFVGLTTTACLANLGHEIVCVDIDEKRIEELKEGKIPFYEQGLKELIDLNLEKKRINFTTNSREAIKFAEAIFNCVGTPQNEDGSANLSYVFNVVDIIAKTTTEFTNKKIVLINKSTVPPGTARECQRRLEEKTVKVISNPEFLKEGNAVYDFMHPDKIVVGGEDQEAIRKVQKVYSGLERPYLKILNTDWESAEIIKYANNSFLATKISFINEIANICDSVGGNIKLVAKALGMDYRISPKFLNAGLGYGGCCFPKDVRALIDTAKRHGYESKLLMEVDALNKRQKNNLIEKIKKCYETYGNKILTIWGLTFKPKTSDIREAVSLKIITELLELGFKLKVYDPIANNEVKKIFGDCLIYSNSIEESAKESEGIILVTEWDEFRGIDFFEIGKVMKNKVLFDGRNIYQSALLKEAGFKYFGVGRK